MALPCEAVDPEQHARELAQIEAKLAEDGWRERMASSLGVPSAGVTAQFLWNWSRRYGGLRVIFDGGRARPNPLYYGPEASLGQVPAGPIAPAPTLPASEPEPEPAPYPASCDSSEDSSNGEQGQGRQGRQEGRQEGLLSQLCQALSRIFR